VITWYGVSTFVTIWARACYCYKCVCGHMGEDDECVCGHMGEGRGYVCGHGCA
jgi:hypothetical protein